MRKSSKAKVAIKTVTVKSHVRKIKTSRSKALAIVKPAKVSSMAISDQVLLITSVTTAHVALAVSSIAAIVTDETDKAWKFTAVKEGGELGYPCWLPKSTLQPTPSANCYTIAEWFLNKSEGYTRRWLNYNQRHNILAA